MKNEINRPHKDPEFSIVLGGPLYQLYLRIGLAQPSINLWKRRILVIATITWLPLFLLSVINGVAFSGVKIPFIFDLATHARFLGALTLLIAAEFVAHERIRDMIAQFIKRDIITPVDTVKFNAYLNSALQLRNSYWVESLLLMFVIICGHWFWLEYSVHNGSTWYANIIHGKTKINMVGYWYFFVSLPIFQFLLLRWYFRLFIWYRLLWNISRMPLQLNSLHPDRAGGLGFLSNTVIAFSLFLLAHTVLLAGMISNRIWYDGANLLDFKIDMLGVIFLLLSLVLMPLAFFLLPMSQAKRIGTNQYGVMASNFVNTFRTRWLNKIYDKDVVSPDDIQSLADLSNSFVATRDMKVLPFELTNILQLIIIAILPLVPLIFTIIPFDQIIRCVLRIFA